MLAFACKIDETQQGPSGDPLADLQAEGVRTLALTAYDIGKFFYGIFHPSFRNWPSPVHNVNELGCLCWDAMVRALMWRSPEKLQEVKAVVASEKAAGRGVRLKGRESCLFLEAGGTEDAPKVCIQV
jgi:hypothetical protein